MEINMIRFTLKSVKHSKDSIRSDIKGFFCAKLPFPSVYQVNGIKGANASSYYFI